VLHDAAFVPQPRSLAHARPPWRLVSVGTLAQLYKAPDVLIDAVALGVREGLDLHVTFVGDGQYRQALEAQSAGLGLSERVTFVGHLSTKAAIEAHLDASDLFVLPSRQEGLPKAMVEAMARGLPCIGSTVGGIPELLPAEDLVPPGDALALAQKIRAVVTAPERMAHMSAYNLAKAREYREDTLRAKRGSFYRYMQNKTADWQHTSPAPVITSSEK
jgi:glycosyltransferase involved in cell wall biosynthesis